MKLGNYFPGQYITIGYNCDAEYCESDFDSVEEMEKRRQFDIKKLRDETNAILDEYYGFSYFYTDITPGRYEGFSIIIERNSDYYDTYEDKREAHKEITEIKKMLLEFIEIGLVCWVPGRRDCCNKTEAIAAIKEAVEDMRYEVRQTPTYKKYIELYGD